ncbi:hypothetical protein ANO14919_114760 [Xylariales sp. No.14919]|nr:hypothetical protein F5X98DRAFT_248599 [Xylaria grammica]GAW21949.1 hypothetical protein ANO14919_114760 [Xylariales sp. No.14919]
MELLWNVVHWITFFFKLVSLAFVLPIIGLIVFDFCLWLWRLYRPSKPADSPRSGRPPKDHAQRPTPSSPDASSTVVELEPEPQAVERRAAHGTLTGDP